LPPFFEGIRRALSELYRVLRPAGKLCLVLGNTRHCGITVPTAEIATELALLQGFRLVALHLRRQHSATQPQARDLLGQFTSDEAPNQYSYRDEHVVILRKP
jgi:ubiquinone/menaquinone biosynthesis C-methylase UbiE